MKIELLNLLLLLLFINNIADVYCQTKVQAFHFKPNRNADFSVGYLGSVPIDTSLVNANKNINDKPEYCCGDNPTVRDDQVIIHGVSTFQQWFKSSIDPNDGYCHNYGLLLNGLFRVGNGGNIIINNIGGQLEGRAFNNATEFPDEQDEYKELVCWYTQISARALIQARDIGNLYILTNGEIIVYQDGALIYERIGTSDITESDIVEVEVDPVEFSLFEFFGCSRDGTAGRVDLLFAGMEIRCFDVSECDTCGPAESCLENCFDTDITTCVYPQVECGVCNNKTRDCEDDDPCTLNYCQEGTGCITEPIDGCEGCIEDENCITEDLCYPKICIDKLCIKQPIQCYSNDTCFEPICINGICVCTPPPTSTTSSITTIATTTYSTIFTLTSGTTTSQTTDTLTSISTTSTIAPGSTIATTSASTIASTITTYPVTTSSSISNTISPTPSITQCNLLSCPTHYCCIQLNPHSYTCVSKYFDEHCLPDRLKLFK